MNVSADQKQNVKNPVNFSELLEFFTKKTKSNSTFSTIENDLDNMIKNTSENNDSKSENKSSAKKEE